MTVPYATAGKGRVNPDGNGRPVARNSGGRFSIVIAGSGQGLRLWTALRVGETTNGHRHLSPFSTSVQHW
jgi:hypothetical protein